MRASASFAAAALLVLGAGCGASQESNPIVDASERTEARGTARAQMGIDYGPRRGQERRMDCRAELDYRRARARVACDTKGFAFMADRVEVVTIDESDYTRTAGGRWQKVSADEDAQTLDPAAWLRTLRTAAEQTDVVGHGPVRGVETTEYRLLVDPKTAGIGLAAAPKGERLAAVGVWVDREGLVRRIRFSEHGEDDLGKGVITAEFFDYGADLHVEAPAAGEVDEAADPKEELTRCRGHQFDPLGEETVKSTLRRHGYRVYTGLQQCIGTELPFTIDFGNAPFGEGEAAWAVTERVTGEQGHVLCALATRADDQGRTLRTRTEKPNEPYPRGLTEFMLANLTCSVIPTGKRAGAQTETLREAMRALERSLR